MVLQIGGGPSPSKGDFVGAHFKVTDSEGNVLLDTREKDRPIAFTQVRGMLVHSIFCSTQAWFLSYVSTYTDQNVFLSTWMIPCFFVIPSHHCNRDEDPTPLWCAPGLRRVLQRCVGGLLHIYQYTVHKYKDKSYNVSIAMPVIPGTKPLKRFDFHIYLVMKPNSRMDQGLLLPLPD